MEKTGSKPTNNYIQRSDRELIELACAGDQMAFTILFERHHYALMSHIQDILLGGAEEGNFREMSEEPQDVCQETFNKVFQNIKSYKPQYEFTTWLYNIAKNTAIDYIRRRKNMQADAVVPPASDTDKTTPEDNLIGNQETANVMAAISRLPDIYRDVIYLYGVKEYAYEEIAKKLNISLSTVKVRVKRAKDKLATLIDSPIAQHRSKKQENGKSCI